MRTRTRTRECRRPARGRCSSASRAHAHACSSFASASARCVRAAASCASTTASHPARLASAGRLPSHIPGCRVRPRPGRANQHAEEDEQCQDARTVVVLLERSGGTMVFSHPAAPGTVTFLRWHADLSCHISKNSKSVMRLLFFMVNM